MALLRFQGMNGTIMLSSQHTHSHPIWCYNNLETTQYESPVHVLSVDKEHALMFCPLSLPALVFTAPHSLSVNKGAQREHRITPIITISKQTHSADFCDSAWWSALSPLWMTNRFGLKIKVQSKYHYHNYLRTVRVFVTGYHSDHWCCI